MSATLTFSGDAGEAEQLAQLEWPFQSALHSLLRGCGGAEEMRKSEGEYEHRQDNGAAGEHGKSIVTLIPDKRDDKRIR